MKHILKSALMFTALLLVGGIFFASCEKEEDWGIKKIYMPQAALYNGGLTHEYPVPMPNMTAPNYYLDENNILHITLGVYRSGMGELASYSINAYIDAEATSAAVENTNRGVKLPAETYTIPDRVTVPDGSRETTFELTVDVNRLIEDYPTYNKSRMMIVVGISNPSKWELNEELSKTTVIIEGSSFLPVIPIVHGGDFGVGSSSDWVIKDLNNKGFDLMKIKEDDGVLEISVVDYSKYGGDSRFLCYQTLDSPDLVVGKTYTISAMVSILPQNFQTAGGGREMDFAIALMPASANMSSTSLDYKPGDAAFWYLDTNMDAGKSAYPLVTGTSGFTDFAQFNTGQRPVELGNGEFTLDAAHQGGYLVVYVRLRNSCPSVKAIQIDQITINEK